MSVFNIPKADALVLFGGSILTGGDLLAKSFVCLLRKESRCGENPARLDEILQRNKKKKMNLRLEPYEKERLLQKRKDPGCGDRLENKKRDVSGIWFMNRIIYIFS